MGWGGGGTFIKNGSIWSLMVCTKWFPEMGADTSPGVRGAVVISPDGKETRRGEWGAI